MQHRINKTKPRRAYDATRRRQQAAEAQERVLEVAQRLFAERGYAETTMDAIAHAANVAVPTVYAAFQSKRGVLGRLLDRLVSGAPGAPPVLDSARAQAVLAEPDRRRALALFAAHISEVQDRVGPMFEVMRNAARTEPDVAALYARAQQSRYKNLEVMVRKLAERGPLRRGLSVEDAARTAWVLASPETRQALSTHASWSPERYQAWLADTLAAALLPE